MIEAPDIPIVKTTLVGQEGYAACGDSSGVFVYRDTGEWMGKEYDKLRICLIYRKGPRKDGSPPKTPFEYKKLKVSDKALQRPEPKILERVGIYPYLIMPLIKILTLMASDEYGLYAADDKSGYQKELDDLYRKMGMTGRVV